MPTVTLTQPNRLHSEGRLWKKGEPVDVDQATAERLARSPRFSVSFAKDASAPGSTRVDAASPAQGQDNGGKRTGGVKITRGKQPVAAAPVTTAAAVTPSADAQPAVAQAAPAEQTTAPQNDPSTEGAVEL